MFARVLRFVFSGTRPESHSQSSFLVSLPIRRFAFGALLQGLLVAPCYSSLSIELEWDPSPDPRAVGYEIHYGTESGSYTNAVDVGNVTSTSIGDLEAGNSYYFVATAYAAGHLLDSSPSNEVEMSIFSSASGLGDESESPSLVAAGPSLPPVSETPFVESVDDTFVGSESGAVGADYEVDASISGSWHDPERPGEGFLIEVLDASNALVYWFTYDHAGNQAWIAGVGEVEGAHIVVQQAITTTGGLFGTSYDADLVELLDWGELRLGFSDCSKGVVSYAGLPSFGSGSLALERLTEVAEAPCGDAGALAVETPGLSGSYYDPDRDGEGFLIEALAGERALVYWFTYDESGNQAWVFGLGDTDGGTIEVEQAFVTDGGRFGPDFDASKVVVREWGSLSFDLPSCADGAVSFEEFGGGTVGTIPLTRLTTLAGGACPSP